MTVGMIRPRRPDPAPATCRVAAAARPLRSLVLALEFASLTFQRWDRSATNVVSTAIFGDGGAAAVLAGPGHPRARCAGLARVVDTESLFFRGTTHLMGFHLRN